LREILDLPAPEGGIDSLGMNELAEYQMRLMSAIERYDQLIELCNPGRNRLFRQFQLASQRWDFHLHRRVQYAEQNHLQTEAKAQDQARLIEKLQKDLDKAASQKKAYQEVIRSNSEEIATYAATEDRLRDRLRQREQDLQKAQAEYKTTCTKLREAQGREATHTQSHDIEETPISLGLASHAPASAKPRGPGLVFLCPFQQG